MECRIIFPKPIFMKLMKDALNEEGETVVLDKYVINIIRKYLVSKGELKPTNECAHERVNETRKLICCWDCGMIWKDGDNPYFRSRAEAVEYSRKTATKRLIKEGKLAPEPEYAEDGHIIKPLPRGAMIVRDGEEY